MRFFLPLKKNPVFELTTYWFPVRSNNHYTKEPTVREGPEKLTVVFSHAWLILVLMLDWF